MNENCLLFSTKVNQMPIVFQEFVNILRIQLWKILALLSERWQGCCGSSEPGQLIQLKASMMPSGRHQDWVRSKSDKMAQKGLSREERAHYCTDLIRSPCVKVWDALERIKNYSSLSQSLCPPLLWGFCRWSHSDVKTRKTRCWFSDHLLGLPGQMIHQSRHFDAIVTKYYKSWLQFLWFPCSKSKRGGGRRWVY
jgi:hypothetical protein